MDAAPNAGTGSAEAWEHHWRVYDEATQRNPAHGFRRQLIFAALENSRSRPMRILDVGCGQGDFLREARSRFPDAELAGIDFSVAGLDLARERVPVARLARANFADREPLPAELRGFATHAVCSEVLEHLDEPSALLAKLPPVMGRGGQLIVTVPGGPRSAFDVHIGHRRHYSPPALTTLVRGSGFEPVDVRGAGFPVFNLYKIAVILRGRRLVEDLEEAKPPGGASSMALKAFDWFFRFHRGGRRFGWQTFGVFRLP